MRYSLIFWYDKTQHNPNKPRLMASYCFLQYTWPSVPDSVAVYQGSPTQCPWVSTHPQGLSWHPQGHLHLLELRLERSMLLWCICITNNSFSDMQMCPLATPAKFMSPILNICHHETVQQTRKDVVCYCLACNTHIMILLNITFSKTCKANK